MKCIRSFLVVLLGALCLTIAPTFAVPAFAEVQTQIDGEELLYGTLNTAGGDVKDGQTMRLLEDGEDYLVFTKNANVTLDLNGHTLTMSGFRNNVCDYYGIMGEAGTLTVKNGTLLSTANHADPIKAISGTVIIESDVTLDSLTSLLAAEGGGKVIVNGAKLTCTGSTYDACNSKGPASSIEINSGTISQSYDSFMSSRPVTLSVKDGASAIINDGTLYSGSSSTVVVSGANSLFTIAGGTVSNDGRYNNKSGKEGYWVGAATYGGSIVQTGGKVESANGNGLYVGYRDTEQAAASIEVNGGEINAANGYGLVAAGSEEGHATATLTGNASVCGVVGAGIESTGAWSTLLMSGDCHVDGEVVRGAGVIQATGGTFTQGIEDAFVAEGYEAVSTGSTSYPNEVKVVKKGGLSREENGPSTEANDMSVTAQGYNASYDGQPHTISVSVPKDVDATVWYATSPLTDENYETEGSKEPVTRTDVGATLVYYYVKAQGYAPVTGSESIEITKVAAPELTDAGRPAVREGLVYNGEAQELVSAPETVPDGYVIQYGVSKDEEAWTDWSDEMPKGTDVGAYVVRYRYVGDDRHEDFDGAELKVSIAPEEKQSGTVSNTSGSVTSSGRRTAAPVTSTTGTSRASSRGTTGTTSKASTSGQLPGTGDAWPGGAPLAAVCGLGLALIAVGGIQATKALPSDSAV